MNSDFNNGYTMLQQGKSVGDAFLCGILHYFYVNYRKNTAEFLLNRKL